ncbi:MAG: DUF1566 domain-containing protein [Proteobacteria bacterium]|nr:DUF1566 domain-containing protein [Pseudomonadota bacterium]MBU1639626.1 DUF1566 domain-containing protein [Pseudomonadota bacterium]
MIRKICCILSVLLVPSFLQAADGEVPASGQTTCYDATGAVIACAGTGQDGELLTGVIWPTPRFIDNGDGTVTDNLTGLMWMTEANCIGNVNPAFDADGTAGDGIVLWQHGLDFVTAVNATTYDCNVTISYTDWRLPNRKELLSLIDFGQSNPALPSGHPFTGVVSSDYWTSSSAVTLPDDAWCVNFQYGYSSAKLKGVSPVLVWPVRAGQ